MSSISPSTNPTITFDYVVVIRGTKLGNIKLFLYDDIMALRLMEERDKLNALIQELPAVFNLEQDILQPIVNQVMHIKSLVGAKNIIKEWRDYVHMQNQKDGQPNYDFGDLPMIISDKEADEHDEHQRH